MSDARGDLYELGRRAWPDVDLEPAAFFAYLEGRSPDVAHGADLYLACACSTGAPRALAAFEARYMTEVPLFLAGAVRDRVSVEEVKQLVRERLFVASAEGARPKILEYSGRGSLGSWLRVVTLRVAANRRRGLGEDRRAPFEEEDAPGEILPAVDPELAVIKTRYKAEFNLALRAAFGDLSARERLVFRMHFVDGLNIDRIGVVFCVHRATVARWIASARERLLDRTMALLGDRLRLPPSELGSLLKVVRSSLDVSLQALLAEP